MLTFTVFNDVRNMTKIGQSINKLNLPLMLHMILKKNIYIQCQLWHTKWTFIPSHVAGLATVYGYKCILPIKNPSSQVVAGI